MVAYIRAAHVSRQASWGVLNPQQLGMTPHRRLSTSDGGASPGPTTSGRTSTPGPTYTPGRSNTPGRTNTPGFQSPDSASASAARSRGWISPLARGSLSPALAPARDVEAGAGACAVGSDGEVSLSGTAAHKIFSRVGLWLSRDAAPAIASTALAPTPTPPRRKTPPPSPAGSKTSPGGGGGSGGASGSGGGSGGGCSRARGADGGAAATMGSSSGHSGRREGHSSGAERGALEAEAGGPGESAAGNLSAANLSKRLDRLSEIVLGWVNRDG